MNQAMPITSQGFEQVEKELDQLIKVEREEIKVAIAEARELGDLKENAEYHSAKEKQALIEGRISQLQAIVANANVINPATIESETIVFGAKVTLLDVEKDQNSTYQIVGEEESDIKSNKISYKSPLGKALIGKEEGDTVIFNAPKGEVEYEVESFIYPKS